MTFVISIPKDGSATDGSNSLNTRIDILKQVAKRYERLTLPDESSRLVVTQPSRASQVTVISDQRFDSRLSDFFVNGSAWCLSAGSRVAQKLSESVTRRAGILQYLRPVWGSYAAVYAEPAQNRVTAWNTVPAIESICYAETASHVIVGNRPLLVALSAAHGSVSSINLSLDFLIEYLMYGYSMTGQMPFEGVWALPSDTALTVHNGRASLGRAPQGLSTSLGPVPTVEESAEALAVSLRNASKRVDERMQGRSIQMRLSGGKDSRMLLGLMRSSNTPLYGRVFGRSGDDDVILARYLSEAASVHLDVGAAPLEDGSTIRQKAAMILRKSDGIPLSEAHAGAYAGAVPREKGDGIMLGQWPLAKGGAAKKMKYTTSEVQRVIRNQAAPFVGELHRARMDSFFEKWAFSIESTSNLETLYLFSRNFRSNRWMQGLLHLYSRDSHPVYPLCDAEVTAVSDAIRMGDKVTQAAYFKTLERIWPLAVTIPFGSSRWPFDVRGKEMSFAPESYDARNAGVNSLGDQWVGGLEGNSETVEFDSLSGAAGSEVASEIVASDNFNLFKNILDPEFIECLISWANQQRHSYSQQTWRTTISLLWRVYLADLWLSRDWLEL